MEANAVDHMSMWSLISNASLVVQLVMLTLVAASVISWVMIFQRSNALRAAKRALDNFEDRFYPASTCPSCIARLAATRIPTPVWSRSSAPASRNSRACASNRASTRMR